MEGELSLNPGEGVDNRNENKTNRKNPSRKRVKELDLQSGTEPCTEDRLIFESLMENSPVHIFLKDRESRFIRVSHSVELLYGKPREELIGKSMYELFPPEVADKIILADKRILKDGIVISYVQESNGRVLNTIKFPVYMQGSIKMIAGFITDLTQLRETEDLLKQKIRDLEKYNEITVDRELKMIQLKKEVNELLNRLGLKDKYLNIK